MSIISGTSIVEFKNFLNEYEEKGIIVSKFRTYIKEFINKNKEKKQKKTRNPSDYNKFVKECMLNDDDIKKEGLTQGEKMKICAKKWEDYKNDNPELFEKKDNQKKTNVLPKKIKIKLDFPVDSDDNSDEKKVDEKKVDEKKKDEKKNDEKKKDEKKIKKEEEKKIKKEAKEAEKKAKKEAKEAEKKAKKEAKKHTKKEDKKEDSSDDEYDFDANVDSYLNDE